MLQASPRLTARVAGVFELLEGSASLFGQQYVVGLLVVSRDAAATADNVLAQEGLFRLGIAVSLLAVVFHLIWGLLLYELLRVVDRRVSLFANLLLVVGSGLQAVAGLVLLAPLVVLRGGDALAAFAPDQLRALALLSFRLNTQAYDIFLAFFGVWLLVVGYLIFRSTFLPRLIGVGLMLEGLGWMTYFSPPLGVALFPVTTFFGLFGELPLLAWLLIKGVNAERWKAQAAASGHVRVGDPG
jgi:hypothetical protein